MRVKYGVRVGSISPQMVLALMVADAVYNDYGLQMFVTSISEGKHGVDSLHYKGNAVDLRIRNVDRSLWRQIADEIRVSLTDEYDVLLEADHIHIEFDPKVRG